MEGAESLTTGGRGEYPLRCQHSNTPTQIGIIKTIPKRGGSFNIWVRIPHRKHTTSLET